jgi:sugar phosphate isomerase/epimerase
MNIGIVTLTFPNRTNKEAAQIIADNGFTHVQLFFCQTDSNYWRYNGRADVTHIRGDEAQRIIEPYRNHNLNVTALGVYTNPIEPDDSEWEKNLNYFSEMMRIANEMDIPVLITEGGHIHREGKEDLGATMSEASWKRIIQFAQRLIEPAQKYDVVVAFEPYFLTQLSSAKRTRDFLEIVNSDRIRVLLDAANLLPNNSPDEMFAQLSPYIVGIHAKDRKIGVHGGVPAGEGDLDYARFVQLCEENVPHLPIIIEYVTEDNFLQAKAHLLGFLKK